MKPKGVTLDRVKQATQAIRALETLDILVGVPAEHAGRDDGSKLNNAEIGYIHEHGAPEQNIPARPFLIPAIEENRGKFAERFKQLAKRVADVRKASADVVIRELGRIGLLAQSTVRKKVTDGPFKPLAESTLANRHRRGLTRTKPLIDTGQLLSSINYVIRKK